MIFCWCNFASKGSVVLFSHVSGSILKLFSEILRMSLKRFFLSALRALAFCHLSLGQVFEIDGLFIWLAPSLTVGKCLAYQLERGPPCLGPHLARQFMWKRFTFCRDIRKNTILAGLQQCRRYRRLVDFQFVGQPIASHLPFWLT